MSENPETPQPAEPAKRDLSAIAAEVHGAAFVGEVTETPAEEVTNEPAPETPPEEITEPTEPGGAEPEVVEATEDTEPEAVPAEPEVPMFTVKIDGIESQVSQADIIKSYQLNQATEKNLEEGKARAAEIVGDAEARDKTLNEQMGVAAIILNSKFEALAAERGKIDWDALEVDDPATFAAKRLKFQDRENAIRGEIETARVMFAKAQEKQVVDNKAAQDADIDLEHTKLIKLVPEWKDPKVADKEGQEISEYFLRKGVPAEDIKNLNKAIGWSIGRDAMLGEKYRQSKGAAAKKVNAAPKTIKPGAAKAAGAGTSKKLAAAQAKAKASGSTEDAMAVMRLKRELAA